MKKSAIHVTFLEQAHSQHTNTSILGFSNMILHLSDVS